MAWSLTTGFAKVIGRTQSLDQSHLDRAEMTRQGYWVQPGSTPTAPDGRMKMTVLV